MAAMALEQLIAMGGKRFILFGTCGALVPALPVGSVFMPQDAVSEEGVSAHYPLAAPPSASAALALEVESFLARRGLAVTKGKIWTTDAPYRETREKVARYAGMGCAAVDMEFSALIAVAAFRKVELVAVMVASDALWGDAWQPGFSSKEFVAARGAVRRALLEYCDAYGAGEERDGG